MGEQQIITPQTYPLWAAEVPMDSSDQPLMTHDGETVTEDLVDFIFPHTYRVVAWQHGDHSGDGPAVLPVLVGAAHATTHQHFEFAEEREEAENLARLRIRERLHRRRGVPVG